MHKINSSAHNFPTVAILLCTYQGQKFLQAQLDSFLTQTHSNWVLWVSDDGSNDGTHAILNQALKAWGKDKISIQNGPKEGFSANFLSLTCKMDIQADYYAYSDQDDIWQSDKLARALAVLKTVPADVSALYCPSTLVVDADDRPICTSPFFTKLPSFANALIQNIGGGNTMVFNDAARKLLIEAGKSVNVVTHDWWVYLLVSGCGGQIFYDAEPTVRYRQHEHNLVGMNASMSARLKRIIQLFKGKFREWTDLNITALNSMRVHLTPKNQQILNQFVVARQQPLLRRMLALKSSGIYRQTLFGKLGLIVGAVFNKI